MGGFGAYHLASHAPDLFAGVGVIAGHGQGTMDPEDEGYSAPQPESGVVFRAFLDRCAPRLAQLPALVVVHAVHDMASSYGDACALVKRVRAESGRVHLHTVQDDEAESDPRRKKSKSKRCFHRYFNFALLGNSSDAVLYDHLGLK